MRRPLLFAAALLAAPPAFGLEKPTLVVDGLKTPESVCVNPAGKLFVTAIGDFDKDGDGAVLRVENGKATPFVSGLDDPKGIAAYQKFVFVTDKTRVLRIDTESGKVDQFAPAVAFPQTPLFLNDVAVDQESGTVFVTDSGDRKGGGGAVYRITPQGQVSLLIDSKILPGFNSPNGVAMDGAAHILVGDMGTGELLRVKLATATAERVADGLGRIDGIAWDPFGRLFLSDVAGGKVYAVARPGDKPVLLAEGFNGAADLCYDPVGKRILVPALRGGALYSLPATVPGAEVDETPLAVGPKPAFPDLKWTGWSPQTDDGRPAPLRPIVLTHAGDGSNRVFVATEQGVIHTFPNDPKATATKVFLDLSDRVKYDDKTNEEGFLGLAFHPKYKENGEFFVFYTPKNEKLTNKVSRFRVSKTDPDKADPASEEVLLTFKKPFWNHDGGTVAFGPDGYLYVTHGDGGAGNDPFDNGQNAGKLLGKILRIDVNAKADGKPYAIPKDNPFADGKGGAPEVFAHGFRNVWRFAFDKKTGQLWAADVGQNLFEEINLVTKGGNYGWNRREGLHPFGARGTGPRKEFIDPIWEYHHDIGKSVTGGTVYRGPAVPELDGHYVYGDYVSAKLWALKYDDAKGRVVANRPLTTPNVPILSFGEDDKGDLYLLTTSATGKGLYKFQK